MSKAEEITSTLADLDEELTLGKVEEALKERINGQEILKACQEGMNEVGARFERQDYFVSDLIMSGEIFKQVDSALPSCPTIRFKWGAVFEVLPLGVVTHA